MFAVYITHPQVRIDPAVPVPEWGLSEIGVERSLVTAGHGWVKEIGRFLSSDEVKAQETAAILAAGRLVEVLEHSGENDRSATGFLKPDAFEDAADWFFAHPTESFRGWERASDAQARIVAAVFGALEKYDPNIPVAFVGHGGVGTLLKCHLAGVPIARHDQPPGGGNLFAFSLADRSLACDWTPMEQWRGWMK
ncbi:MULTISPECIES: histidine phosphatase family protein [unclassified Rhizobium]|uniref:histidine phosphatase family protein n=1 Tax=unclassified Rhizobium TaxID=2613769 RepID=UPI0006FEC3E9|nr:MULTISPECIES: histidine phosphatase family protein [unclassified Rhizobium]KQV44262.1 phosphoglycerate mutase [Rhizobium sp. Root1212]KRD38443.1 phosphoglycerate mutase [Rhizobium sp. Root268]